MSPSPRPGSGLLDWNLNNVNGAALDPAENFFPFTGKKPRRGLLSTQSADLVGENFGLPSKQRVSLTNLIISNIAVVVLGVTASGTCNQIKENAA